MSPPPSSTPSDSGPIESGRHSPRISRLTSVELAFTWWAAAIAAAVVGFPLLARACEQAFADTDPRYESLARTLGHSPLRAFLRVGLPLARRGIAYGALLAFTRVLGEFGATALVAGILPGRTETLALGIWSRVLLGEDRDALVLCACSFALATLTSPLVLAEESEPSSPSQTLTPSLLLDTDARLHSDDDEGQDGLALARARLGFTGQFAPWGLALARMELAGGQVSIYQAYV